MDILATISTAGWALIVGIGFVASLATLYFLKSRKKHDSHSGPNKLYILF